MKSGTGGIGLHFYDLLTQESIHKIDGLDGKDGVDGKDGQNGKNVVEYHLWTPKWTEMLQASKFKKGGDFPYAFDLLNNMGGEKHEGYIGLQDHGDNVQYRNIRIKVMD